MNEKRKVLLNEESEEKLTTNTASWLVNLILLNSSQFDLWYDHRNNIISLRF